MFLCMNKFLKPENIFILLALICGLFILFITPPFQTADETNHFLRSYSISSGNIKDKLYNSSAGNFLPKEINTFINIVATGGLLLSTPHKINKDTITQSKKIKINAENKYYEFPNTVLYSPIAYAPQTAGVATAKTFTNSLYWMFIFGRIFNLIFYILLGYFAIKSIPLLKWVVILILLLPMNLSLAASFSPDPVLLSLSILYFSKILQYTFDKNNEINWQRVLILSILAITISLIKQSWLFVLFALIIPKNKWGKNYFLKLSAILLPSLFCMLLWTKIATSVYIPLNGASPQEQTKYLLTHPFTYIITFYKSISHHGKYLYYQVIGALGWLNIYLTREFYIAAPIFGIINTIFSKNKSDDNFKLPLLNNIILFALTIIIFVYICTTIYLSYTPPGDKQIIGLQGRYFEMLLLPFAAFIALNIKTKQPNKFIVSANIIYLIVLLIYLFSKLHRSFYI